MHQSKENLKIRSQNMSYLDINSYAISKTVPTPPQKQLKQPPNDLILQCQLVLKKLPNFSEIEILEALQMHSGNFSETVAFLTQKSVKSTQKILKNGNLSVSGCKNQVKNVSIKEKNARIIEIDGKTKDLSYKQIDNVDNNVSMMCEVTKQKINMKNESKLEKGVEKLSEDNQKQEIRCKSLNQRYFADKEFCNKQSVEQNDNILQIRTVSAEIISDNQVIRKEIENCGFMPIADTQLVQTGKDLPYNIKIGNKPPDYTFVYSKCAQEINTEEYQKLVNQQIECQKQKQLTICDCFYPNMVAYNNFQEIKKIDSLIGCNIDDLKCGKKSDSESIYGQINQQKECQKQVSCESIAQNEVSRINFQAENNAKMNFEKMIDQFTSSILEQLDEIEKSLKKKSNVEITLCEITAILTSIEISLQHFQQQNLQVPPFVQKRVDEMRLQIKEFQQTQITKSTQEDRFQKESDAQQIIHKPISIQPDNQIENDSQFQGNQIITPEQLQQLISAQSNYPGIQIKNTYASCYANTAIQTLISISALRSLLNSEYYLNVRSPFIQPLREILNTHNTLIEPEQFYDNLSIFSMSKWEQSDAAELFMLLIGHLHEAESEAANLPYTNEATAIQQLFGCVMENRTECMRCGRTKVSQEVTRCQFLPFQKSIKQSLRASCKAVEIQGYNCDDCGKDVVLMKSQCIARAARCVVFQIDRWGSGGEKCCDGIKIKEAIEFQDGVTHQLKAVICHQGDSARCGHFYCYVYTGWGWELRNDEVVQQVGFDQICLNNVYMLIYEQDNNISYSGISQETFSYPREVIARMISSKNITRQEELDYQQQPFNLQQYQQDIGYDNTKQETIDQYLYQQNIITYDDPKESVQIGDGQQQPVYFQQDQYGNSYDMEQERIHQSQENIIYYDPRQDNLQVGYYNFYQEENAGNFSSQNQMIPRGEDQYHQQQLVSIEQNSYYIGYDNMEQQTTNQNQQNIVNYDDPQENYYIGDDNFQTSPIVVLEENQTHTNQEITDTSNKQQPSEVQQKIIDKFSSDILMQIDKLNMLNEQQKQDFSECCANQVQQLITIIQKSINLFTQTNLQLPNYAQKRINVFRKQLSQ